MAFLKSWFGNFSRDELKKFLLLGVVFAIIIGVYWTLRPLKDSIFQSIVGGTYQPMAKILSLFTVFPLVMAYSKLVEKLPKHKLFYVLSTIYGLLGLLFCVLFYNHSIGLANTVPDSSRIVGWAWYVFVESFGSLVVSLFWGFSTDITSEESAKRGFSVVVMLGQIGGIAFPLFFTYSMKFWKILSSKAVVGICSVAIFLIIPLVMLFMKIVPQSEMIGYVEKTSSASEHKEEAEPGFLEGLRLLVSQAYLLGIFAIITFFELVVTVIDYHFKLMVNVNFATVDERTIYLLKYGVFTNGVTFLCLLFGISNIQRKLGLKTSLALMPFIVAGAVYAFMKIPPLETFFWIMVASKGINYALNGPAIKQLYIPTTKEVRYKSQAWIESFGSRGSKGLASTFTNLHKKLLVAKNGAEWAGYDKVPAIRNLMYSSADLGSKLHIQIASGIFFGMCIVWFFIALFLGNKYQKAIDNKEVVC